MLFLAMLQFERSQTHAVTDDDTILACANLDYSTQYFIVGSTNSTGQFTLTSSDSSDFSTRERVGIFN